MNPTILSATAGLVSSLVGGVPTFALMADATRPASHANPRPALYDEFIVEAAKRFKEA
jgi:hypothetical protein